MKQYILSKNIDECPECKSPWTDDYIAMNMPRNFITTDLKEHRKRRILEEIKSELPHYQEDAQRYKRALDIKKKQEELLAKMKADFQTSDHDKKYWELKDAYNALLSSETTTSTELTLAKLKFEIFEKKCKPPTITKVTLADIGFPSDFKYQHYLKNTLMHFADTYIYSFGKPYNMERHPYFPHSDKYTDLNFLKGMADKIFGENSFILADGHQAKKSEFIQKCPLNDCKGFLKSNWACGLCDKTVCSRCFLEKNSGHECNKDDVETAKLIKKETRECPGCNIRIFKIDGCNQMWCVECHTTFDWVTGNIVTSKTHNPHYYEWLRKTQGSVPREPGDNDGAGPCNVVNDINHMLIVSDATIFRYINDTSYHKKAHIYFADLYYGSFDSASTKYIEGMNAIITKSAPRNPKDIYNYATAVLIYNKYRHALFDEDTYRENRYNTNKREHIIKYLANELDDAPFAQKMYKNKIDYDSEKHYHDIMKTLLTVLQDTIPKMYNSTITLKQGSTVIENIIKFTNDSIKFINKKYNKFNEIVCDPKKYGELDKASGLLIKI
jgi:hypothetical protein